MGTSQERSFFLLQRFASKVPFPFATVKRSSSLSTIAPQYPQHLFPVGLDTEAYRRNMPCGSSHSMLELRGWVCPCMTASLSRAIPRWHSSTSASLSIDSLSPLYVCVKGDRKIDSISHERNGNSIFIHSNVTSAHLSGLGPSGVGSTKHAQ